MNNQALEQVGADAQTLATDINKLTEPESAQTLPTPPAKSSTKTTTSPALATKREDFGDVTLTTTEVEPGLTTHYDVTLSDKSGAVELPSAISPELAQYDVYWQDGKASSLPVELIEAIRNHLDDKAAA